MYGSREVWIVFVVFGSALTLEVTGIATGHKVFPSLGDYASNDRAVSFYRDFVPLDNHVLQCFLSWPQLVPTRTIGITFVSEYHKCDDPSVPDFG